MRSIDIFIYKVYKLDFRLINQWIDVLVLNFMGSPRAKSNYLNHMHLEFDSYIHTFIYLEIKKGNIKGKSNLQIAIDILIQKRHWSILF